jgi:hypothetical protein
MTIFILDMTIFRTVCGSNYDIFVNDIIYKMFMPLHSFLLILR